MNKPATSFLRKHKIAVVAVLVLILGFVAVHLIVGQLLTDLRQTIEGQITEQKLVITDIANTTARGGADEITEKIIKDCSVTERTEFDQLLGKLGQGLSVRELTTLERLFGRCASFYSDRKSVTVARLSREVEVYAMLVDQLKMIEGEGPVAAYKVDDWRRLVLEEERQSKAFAELVVLQGKIIDTLLSGSHPKSDEVVAVLLKVKETQETLSVASKQAATIRESLVAQ